MSLTRKLLESLGLESDKISTIIEAHAETVDALKEKAEKYKADAEKAATFEAEIAKIKAENESLKAGDDWKKKFDELNSEFEGYKTEQANKALEVEKSKAYKALLREAGISEKAVDIIIKGVDMKGIELEDGKIKDSDKLSESFKTEYKDFITQTNISGANTTVPPANNPPKTFTYEDISKMSRDEINANWSAISKSLSNKGE